VIFEFIKPLGRSVPGSLAFEDFLGSGIPVAAAAVLSLYSFIPIVTSAFFAGESNVFHFIVCVFIGNSRFI